MNATPNIERLYRKAKLVAPGLTNLGFYNRRLIAGTNRWSQHAYADVDRGEYGNAVDLTSPYPRPHNKTQAAQPQFAPHLAMLDEVVDFLVTNWADLGIDTLLWRGKSIRTGNPVPDHWDHAHVDCNPRGVGTPPLPTNPALFPLQVAYRDLGTIDDHFALHPEDDEMDPRITDEAAKVLEDMTAALEEAGSNGGFAKYAVDLIRRERTLPLHKPVSGLTEEQVMAIVNDTLGRARIVPGG